MDTNNSSSSHQQLSNLVLLHSNLQQEISELFDSNSQIKRKNLEIEMNLAEINKNLKFNPKSSTNLNQSRMDNEYRETNEFQEILNKKAEVENSRLNLQAENLALNALEKRIQLVENRVQSLTARLAALQLEEQKNVRSLLEDCSLARQRLQSSYQAQRTRKQIEEERLQEQRSELMRVQNEFDLLQEEKVKLAEEIQRIRNELVQTELNCKKTMDDIANVVRMRRNRPKINRVIAHQPLKEEAKSLNTAEQVSFSDSTSSNLFGSFDVVKAFRNQTGRGF